MMRLERFAYLPEGTLGKLTTDLGLDLYTIERPWLDNKPWVSCIPEGEYDLVLHRGTRWPQAIRLHDTSPRTAILIHPANKPSELHGCIAPGLDWTIKGKAPMVTSSRKALALIKEEIGFRDALLVSSEDGWKFGTIWITSKRA